MRLRILVFSLTEIIRVRLRIMIIVHLEHQVVKEDHTINIGPMWRIGGDLLTLYVLNYLPEVTRLVVVYGISTHHIRRTLTVLLYLFKLFQLITFRKLLLDGSNSICPYTCSVHLIPIQHVELLLNCWICLYSLGQPRVHSFLF